MNIKPNTKNKDSLIISVVVLITAFLCIVFFGFTFTASRQLFTYERGLKTAVASGDLSIILKKNFVFTPYSYMQHGMRYSFLSYVFGQYKIGKGDQIIDILPEAIKMMEESVAKEPNYPHHFALLGKTTDALAEFKPQQASTLHLKAEEYYKKALTLSPYNQDAIYGYVINLSNQNRVDEAIVLLRKTLSYDERISETHYYLALMLIRQDEQKNADETLLHSEFALDHNVNITPSLTRIVYDKLFIVYYNRKDPEKVLLVLKRLKEFDPAQDIIYAEIIKSIEQNHKVPLLNLYQ